MQGITGEEATVRILRTHPHLKIVALSNYDEITYVQSMLDAGASGFILKTIEPAQMLAAVKTIIAGKKYFSNEIAVKLLESKESDRIRTTRKKGNITNRELEVLQLIVTGMTNEVIAEKLGVAKRTIDTHRQNLLLKLRVNNTAGLIRSAYNLKLIK